METIIASLLDTDLYKLTQMQVVFHQYPNARVVYEFKCRDKNAKLGYLVNQIKKELELWPQIYLLQEEKKYLLNKIPFLSIDYVDCLETFRFNPSLVKVWADENDELCIRIEGLWKDTILFEVPLLATINELHFANITNFSSIEEEGKRLLREKIELIKTRPRLVISEFGTRRRYSRTWQEYVLKELLVNCTQVIGTSNVYLAKYFGKKAIGTMAHEFCSAHLALVDDIRQAQKRAFHVWQQEYDDNLGIALTDTFTTKAFFQDFDKTLSRTFAGVRQDSGDPIEFGWNVIEHYKNFGIDPRTKTIVFSDGLNIPKAIKIFDTFAGLIGVSFGIGTDFTNSLGVKPLNIVIKLIECNGIPVVKLSDVATKNIGDVAMIRKVKQAYGFEIV